MKWTAFRYLSHGYKFEKDGSIVGCGWRDVPAGKMVFGQEMTKAIHMWCDNEGFAGLSLERYLDRVLGPAE